MRTLHSDAQKDSNFESISQSQQTPFVMTLDDKVGFDNNKDLFTAAFNSSPIGTAITRLSDALIIDVNEAFLRLIECKHEEAVGINIGDLGIFKNPNERNQLANSLKNGKIRDFEIEIQTKKGKHLTVLAAIDKFSHRGETYILLTVVDITERKKIEEALTISEQKYRMLFSNMTNGFAYCKMIEDPEGKPLDFVYLEVNDSFEELTGLKKSMVIGKTISEAIPAAKRDHPEIFEIYGRVASTGKSEHFELFFKPLSVWLSIFVYSPKIGYFVAVFENVTEKRQMDKLMEEYSEGLELTVADRTQELVRAQNRLVEVERFSAIGELAGMVGHDLRNPLTGIKNAAYMLRKNQSKLVDNNSTEMLNTIDRAVDHANSIVGDLLDFSREIHLELEEHSPKSFVNYVLLAIKIPSNIVITQHIEESPCFWVDANKMERVFTNLIKNAIDAMPNGGRLEISSHQNADKIDFAFTDNGVGMSQEVIAKIFTPLFTTKSQGMGFGLAICKRIIEAHGGKITVESNPGKGTTFTLSIPILKCPLTN
jgi:PAS domain S-box-containing protein